MRPLNNSIWSCCSSNNDAKFDRVNHLFQHLIKSVSYKTLKQVQGDL